MDEQNEAGSRAGRTQSLMTGSLENSVAVTYYIDETSIRVRGFNGYVWALTSMEEVAYFFTPTREGNTIQELLKTFLGRFGLRFLRGVRCDRLSAAKMSNSFH